MNLKMAKRLAAKVLKVGKNKVRFNPEDLEDISQAMTREDMRVLIAHNTITKKPETGVSRGRAKAVQLKKKSGQKRGLGSRKGTKGARMGKKSAWVKKVRAQRKELLALKENGVDVAPYREMYRKIKGGFFKSRQHVKQYATEKGYMEGK